MSTIAICALGLARPASGLAADLSLESGGPIFTEERLAVALTGYQRLAAEGGWASLPTGLTLEPGDVDTRVPVLAARLAATGDLAPGDPRQDNTRYDSTLGLAVRRFQARHGLKVDALVGPLTRAALNLPAAHRAATIARNIERLATPPWNPQDRYIVVNIPGFEVISGYRSPRTNAALQKKSNRVAKKSLHMRGMAIDIRLPSVNLPHLREAAIALKGGGVGYYPKSNFVHVDIGRVRTW